MNKELILKYKAEFDHSLYGGKLQVKFVNDPWEEAPEDIFSYSTVNFVLVIDDEYVEFRKALAEGKIVQYRNLKVDAFKNWQDLGNLKFNPNFEHRIKPEEPKFKVGDWVRDGKNIYQFIEPSSIHSYESSLQRCELWQPKPGEFCWFWNEPSDIPILAKLISIEYFLEKPTEYKIKTPSYISETVYSCMTYMYFKNCEPFIGQLPTILKD